MSSAPVGSKDLGAWLDYVCGFMEAADADMLRRYAGYKNVHKHIRNVWEDLADVNTAEHAWMKMTWTMAILDREAFERQERIMLAPPGLLVRGLPSHEEWRLSHV